jgi:hypothetical protein
MVAIVALIRTKNRPIAGAKKLKYTYENKADLGIRIQIRPKNSIEVRIASATVAKIHNDESKE